MSHTSSTCALSCLALCSQVVRLLWALATLGAAPQVPRLFLHSCAAQLAPMLQPPPASAGAEAQTAADGSSSSSSSSSSRGGKGGSSGAERVAPGDLVDALWALCALGWRIPATTWQHCTSKLVSRCVAHHLFAAGQVVTRPASSVLVFGCAHAHCPSANPSPPRMRCACRVSNLGPSQVSCLLTAAASSGNALSPVLANEVSKVAATKWVTRGVGSVHWRAWVPAFLV